MKICNTCREPGEFAKSSSTKDGLQAKCKVCAQQYWTIWHKRQDRRVRNEWNKKSRQRNLETYKVRSRKHRSLYRARKAKVIYEHIDPLVVLELDDGVCGICNKDVDPFNYQVDHIVPISKGGSHTYSNTQAAHKSCNCSKGNKINGYFV